MSGSQCGHQDQEHSRVILKAFHHLFTIFNMTQPLTCYSDPFAMWGPQMLTLLWWGHVRNQGGDSLTQWQTFSKICGPIFAPACCGLRGGESVNDLLSSLQPRGAAVVPRDI